MVGLSVVVVLLACRLAVEDVASELVGEQQVGVVGSHEGLEGPADYTVLVVGVYRMVEEEVAAHHLSIEAVVRPSLAVVVRPSLAAVVDLRPSLAAVVVDPRPSLAVVAGYLHRALEVEEARPF